MFVYKNVGVEVIFKVATRIETLSINTARSPKSVLIQMLVVLFAQVSIHFLKLTKKKNVFGHYKGPPIHLLRVDSQSPGSATQLAMTLCHAKITTAIK